jgi:hypothetical protein
MVFKCDLCDYKAKYNSHLKQHKAHVHDIDVKWYYCDICDYKAKSNSGLKQHKAYTHDIDVKWYYCDICDYKAKSNSNMKQHKANIHDIGVKWYYCGLCDYKAKNNSHLKLHKTQAHDIDVKWYYCDICDFKAKTNSNMKQHKANIHDIDVKWYYCDICDFKAKTNSDLKLHKANVHDIDVKWYYCDICDYKAKTNSHIKQHKSNVHDVGDINCPICLRMVNKISDFKDKSNRIIKGCRKCYRKTVGFNTRVEKVMAGYLKDCKEISPYIIIEDSILKGKYCFRKFRPDILIASPELSIMVECDENEHKYYNKSCELARMDTLLHELEDSKRRIIIRWNPDSYSIEGVKQKTTRKERLEKLKQLILDIIHGKVNVNTLVYYMFYSDDNVNITDIQTKEFII